MKTILAHRFLVLFALGMVIGIGGLNDPWSFLALPILGIWIRKPSQVGSLALGLGLGLLLGIGGRPARIDAASRIESVVSVTSVPRSYSSGWAANVRSGSTLLRMTWQGDALYPGDRVRVVGQLQPLDPLLSPSLHNDGVSGRLRANSLQKVSSGPALLRFPVEYRNEFEKLSHKNNLITESKSVPGICLNMDADLPEDFREALSRTGTIHIVSASGFHVGLLVVGLHFLSLLLPFPRAVRLGFILGAVGMFALAAGAEPPVMRSFVMVSVLIPAYLMRRQGDPLTAAAVALIIELFIRPYAIYDIGVQLSYVTAAFLILFLGTQEPLGDDLTPLKSLLVVFKASTVAWIASLPLVAYHFGQVSLISVLANLSIAFLVPLILVTGLGASALMWVLPQVANLLYRISSVFASWLESIVRLFSSFEWSSVYVGAVPIWFVYAAYFGLLLLLRNTNEA